MSSSRKPDEPALVTALFSRRLAEPFARLAVRLGISADAVTVAGGLCWMLSLPLPILAGWLRQSGGSHASSVLWLASAVLWCLGYWLDVVDGSVARLTGTSSRAGFFLDCVFHLLFKPAFLFSVGLGVALGLPGTCPHPEAVDLLFFALAVLSLPANGAAATSAAELALCEEVALGRLRPDGAARPALWLGAADVADTAAEKRRTPLRAAKTLAQETLSYYLQAPFFALLVCIDLVLRWIVRGTVVCDSWWLPEFVWTWEMPCTAFGFAALSLVLFLRIPLRLARESRRLGRPTRAGRAGRVLARLGALSTALGAAALLLWPWAAPRIPNERRFLLLFFALFFAPVAFLLLGAGLRAAAVRATRRAGLPIHGRYLLRAFDLLLAPTAVGAFAVFLAGNYGYAFGFLFSSAPHWPIPFLLCLAPLAAVACRPVASETLAHVLCQETGKGRLRPGDPAPWDAPAPRLVAWVAITVERLLLADMALMLVACSVLSLGGREVALLPLPDRLDGLVSRGGLPLSCAGFVLLALALLLSLPRRLRAARRRLSAAPETRPAPPPRARVCARAGSVVSSAATFHAKRSAAMFKPVSSKVDFDAMEKGVLSFWQENDTFRKSLAQTEGGEQFVFFDGPPFATGLPHYGHLLAGTIKDIIPRYQTMRGKHVERRFGWDTHGLPIEALAQKALGIDGAAGIRDFGVDRFNEQCRSMVLRYVSEWRETVTRMGRWVDFDHDYKTMEPTFMETVWWVFKQIFDQGRVYRSRRIVPYSWALNTPLSNSEASSNYKDVQDPTVTCRLKVLSGADPAWGTTYLLIWTTTPWTLPENLAVCAGAKIDYVVVRDKGEGVCYTMAEARLPAIYKKADDYEVVARFKGDALKGWTYEPLFPYFEAERARGAFRVLNDDYVTTDDGVGLVHIAPAYGEDDFRVCKENGVEAFADPLDADCKFTSAVPEYAGRFCKDCDKDIIKRLKAEGRLVHQATITHSYPFCERTDTPLIYRAIPAWYIRVEDLHERFAKNNAAVAWMPEYVGEKRFANWLAEARDWNVSRNRFWGSCIPIWVNEQDENDLICVGSVAELEALSGEKVTDLHKHFVDKIVIRRDGKTYRRTPEVLDCWFESGSMPYAQVHYPFAFAGREKEFLKRFPADFIAEGLDQTRGWFYSLMVLGTLLFDESPYRHVVVNGLVLAEDGKKMSKHLKNYPDPMELVGSCGADAVRLYMINSAVVRAENLRFSESGVRQILRDLLIPWWNAYSFFVTYANVDGWHEERLETPDSPNELDRWIVSSLETLVADVTAAMDRYDLQKSVRPFVAFVENLTNWYIRRSRRRFWKSQNDADKAAAYRTLRYVLVQLCKIAAPFTPFIAEEIYRNLRGAGMPESVHLCAFPEANAAARDVALEARMAAAQRAVALGHNLRKQKNLKVRQPLARAVVVCAAPGFEEALAPMAPVIAEELNVKAVEFAADESRFVTLSAKANFKVLGKKLGPRMKAAAAAIAALPAADIAKLQAGEGVSIQLPPAPGGASSPSEPFTLLPEDVLVQRSENAGLTVANDGDLSVALDPALTPELVAEGIAREFVSHVQSLRKEADLDVADRIRVSVSTDAEAAAALRAHAEFVKGETLALDLAIEEGGSGGSAPRPLDLNGHPAAVAIEKA